MITAATSKYTSAPSTNNATTDHVHAAIVPTDTSVSIVVARWRRFASVAAWMRHPAHHTTGVESANASHAPAVEVQALHHRQHDQWHGEQRGRDESRQHRARFVGLGLGRRRVGNAVPEIAHGPAQLGGTDRGGVVDNRGPRRREVHVRRIDAGHLRQAPLDARRARGARHALDREIDTGRHGR